MGLREIGAVQGTNEYTQRGNDVAAGFNVLEGINPASTLIAVNRMEGVTTTLAVPGYLGVPPSNGLIWGQAALIDLNGATIETMRIKSPAAIVAGLSEAAKDASGGSRAAVAQRLRRVLNDAREYATRRADYRRRQIQDLSASAADLEALQPVLRGELPLIVLANRRSDIETALRIAREYKLRLILAGAAEGWMIPGELAAAGVPVLIEPMDRECAAARQGRRESRADGDHDRKHARSPPASRQCGRERDDVGPGAAGGDADAGRDLWRGGSLRITGRGEGCERRRLEW